MIKSAKEAREIVKDPNYLGASNRLDQFLFKQAVGYLAALEGPEVKALVAVLEEEKNYTLGWVNKAREVLAQYREAIKP